LLTQHGWRLIFGLLKNLPKPKANWLLFTAKAHIHVRMMVGFYKNLSVSPNTALVIKMPIYIFCRLIYMRMISDAAY
jgi:hypothetical protein